MKKPHGTDQPARAAVRAGRCPKSSMPRSSCGRDSRATGGRSTPKTQQATTPSEIETDPPTTPGPAGVSAPVHRLAGAEMDICYGPACSATCGAEQRPGTCFHPATGPTPRHQRKATQDDNNTCPSRLAPDDREPAPTTNDRPRGGARRSREPHVGKSFPAPAPSIGTRTQRMHPAPPPMVPQPVPDRTDRVRRRTPTDRRDRSSLLVLATRLSRTNSA